MIALLTAAAAFPCLAEIGIELVGQNKFRVQWHGREVVLPSRPELRRIGGGTREVFDPTARVFRKVEMTASQSVQFQAVSKQGDPVFLGDGKSTFREEVAGLVYRQDFVNAGAWWQVRLQPVGDNGLDVVLEAEVAPEFWLTALDARIMDLNLDRASADSGHLGQWRRNLPTTKGLLVGPLPGVIRINYPSSNLLVPAAVLQDSRLAMGICRLGVHDTWRAQFGELILSPKRRKCEVRVTTGWAEAASTKRLYQSRFEQKYRLRFAEPRAPGPAGYVQLIDAEDLWIDYMKELDEYVPIQATPAYSREKNNILICNYFMAEPHYVTERNPMGWVMNHPEWKTNPWEFPQQDQVRAATGEELRKLTGFDETNFGRPVKWIKAWAEKNVREMQETKALANVVWRSATLRGANNMSLDYLPDSHYFHPDMEERLAVEGPVRNWDWIVADIEVYSPEGKLIARQEGTEIHSASRSRLRKLARHEDFRQRLAFKAEDLHDGAADYVKSAAGIGPSERYRDHIKLYIKITDPQERLLGKSIGDTVKLEAAPMVGKPALAAKNLTVKATIGKITRAAIDVWAKTLTDADCEIGFLIREDFILGPPWHQIFMRLDWTAEWQYDLLRQRVEWHRTRFGKKCRWFYLDVFANETPDFIMQRLRRDFPDCFFFVEHPNGVALRTLQTWNWFSTHTALELYLNPNALAIILPDRLLTQSRDQNVKLMKKTWKNPHYIYATHRGARRLLDLAREAQLER